MKKLTLPLCALVIGLLSSCYYQPVPGHQAPGYQAPYNPTPNPGYGSGYQQNSADSGKIVHNQGFNLGIRDARQGRQPNYLRYHNLYTNSTQKDFGRGYMTGYRTIRPR